MSSEPSAVSLTDALGDARIGWVPAWYDPRAPSTRLRASLPVAALRRVGVDAAVVPPDHSGSYDCIVFQKAYSEDDLHFARRAAAAGVKVVFDLCDNHFYNPDGLPDLAARAARLRSMVDLADVVSVSVPGLADLIGSGDVPVVDDALEETPLTALAAWRGTRRHRVRSRGPVRLVWFGHAGKESQASGIPHIGGIVGELERLHRSRPIRLTVISDSREMFDRHVGKAGFPTRYVRWTPRGFGRHFVTNDVCVLPIEPNPYTLFKTNNRVRTALLLGVPVVTNEIPSYREFADWIDFGGWTEHILGYADDPAPGALRIEAARSYIRRTYTDDRLVSQWGAVLRRAITSSG
jgi:hypothetical protein